MRVVANQHSGRYTARPDPFLTQIATAARERAPSPSEGCRALVVSAPDMPDVAGSALSPRLEQKCVCVLLFTSGTATINNSNATKHTHQTKSILNWSINTTD